MGPSTTRNCAWESNTPPHMKNRFFLVIRTPKLDPDPLLKGQWLRSKSTVHSTTRGDQNNASERTLQELTDLSHRRSIHQNFKLLDQVFPPMNVYYGALSNGFVSS